VGSNTGQQEVRHGELGPLQRPGADVGSYHVRAAEEGRRLGSEFLCNTCGGAGPGHAAGGSPGAGSGPPGSRARSERRSQPWRRFGNRCGRSDAAAEWGR
jgi:hypothetical protein